MKDATLWKRILNEGLKSPWEFLVPSILSTRIIVCPPMELDDQDDTKIDWSVFSGLSIPFGSFWLEWPVDIEAREGLFVLALRSDAGDFKLTAIAVIAGPGAAPGYLGSFDILIDSKGNPQHRSDGFIGCRPDTAYHAANGDFAYTHLLPTYAYCLCIVLSYLSCKNVSLAESTISDEPTTKRASKRTGLERDSFRYHTLVVRPPGARSNAPTQELGIMPRHVCRGHFSEYGPEFGKGLLFGKYTGRFYIPPHMKGDKKNGEVAKDYSIPVAIGGAA